MTHSPLPVAADIGVFQVEGWSDEWQEAEGHGQDSDSLAAQKHGHVGQSCTFRLEVIKESLQNKY